MNAPFHSPERAAMAVHTFDAVAEAASIAEAYARMASEMAAIGDSRGLRYALRQAAVALASAADAAALLSPTGSRGGA
ncbi:MULTISPECIES: hypothetical protein [unclassified Methylobacterium]|uniref:hypothetical protein n=1 Tax=unclassified Methylobacterium TaxID=2615210 RepID=UPI0011C1D5B1|nr:MULTISPECIES: hypothetical protein [unclassified Methylobacterium]QEE40846.1 hypothetical protein FVA80_19540 [Methylobacterium sp. WL1]TXM99696.1 hypothetical protein FV242_24640 [Methylobacterium sp. WL64]TXN53833.1 hypothetical protein FV241_26555 [Methylobacterium sp. WL2]